MIKQKKALIAGGVVVALGCAWWGLGVYASNKAEDKLVAFLESIGQRDAVHWKSLSASPFGSATLKDVTIGSPSSPTARIDAISIASLRNDADRKSGDVVFRGAAMANGFSPLSTLEFTRQGGKTDLPPATLSLKWDYQRDDDKAEVRIGLEQPDALNANLELALERVNGAVAMGDSGNLGQIAMMGMFGLGRLDRALAPLADLRIKAIDLSVKDEGYVKRSIELYKRYNVTIVPGEGSAEKQRNKNFEKSIDALTKMCIERKQLAGFADNKDACKALFGFASGDDKALKLSASPRSGVALSELINSRLTDFNKALALFSPKLSN